MTTLRKELKRNGFGWRNGLIIWHDTGEFLEEWDDGRQTPGWIWEDVKPEKSLTVTSEHPILDHEYHDGFGGPECPRFVAYDDHYTYFPYQYDGSTGIVRVARNPQYYMSGAGDEMLQTPYPGGG